MNLYQTETRSTPIINNKFQSLVSKYFNLNSKMYHFDKISLSRQVFAFMLSDSDPRCMEGRRTLPSNGMEEQA